MASPDLNPFIKQLGSQTLAVVIVAGVIGIALYAVRMSVERWVERKVRSWKSARRAKRYEGMSDDEILDDAKCPNCAGTMILRTARKGANAGERFWGCGSFPKCKGTRQVSRQ